MSYQPLARKYRPAKFSEIVGQDGITAAMTNAIRLGRIPGAVIFSGVRGVGKTTLARLFAKALSCDDGPTPEPCGACDSCKAVASGTHEDVLEIDGASHTGIDEIRALQETMAYVPRRSKFKIYLIDEVHMLSISAFNALLKTIEETPPNVKFVFATTELGRVPETIQSRCQVFHLKKIPVGVVVARLSTICEKENLAFEIKALEALAQSGRGSLRDALTLLDQTIARGHGAVKLTHVASVGLMADRRRVIAFLSDMVSRNLTQVAAHVAAWDEAGCDLAEVVEECARYARHAFVLKHLGADRLKTDCLGLDQDEEAQIGSLARDAGDGALNRLFAMLMACREELQGASLDRFVIENHCFEWCIGMAQPVMAAAQPAVAAAQRASEAASPGVAAPTFVPTPVIAPVPTPSLSSPAPVLTPLTARLKETMSAASPKVRPIQAAVIESAPIPLIATEAGGGPPSPALPSSWRDLVDIWKKQKPLQARILEEAYCLEYHPNQIVLGVKKESMAAGKLLQPEIQSRAAAEFQSMFGFVGELRIVLHEPQRQGAAASSSLLDDRRRDRDVEHQRVLKEAAEHPITQESLRLFGGTIQTTLTQDPS